MLAIKDTIRKFSVLDDDDATIVINLVDFLSKKQESKNKTEEKEDNPFRRIRENGQQFLMSEEEIDSIIETARKERNAARN